MGEPLTELVASARNVAAVRAMIERYGATIEPSGFRRDGSTALHYAARINNVELVQMLLETTGYQPDTHICDDVGGTALGIVVHQGLRTSEAMECARCLIRHGARFARIPARWLANLEQAKDLRRYEWELRHGLECVSLLVLWSARVGPLKHVPRDIILYLTRTYIWDATHDPADAEGRKKRKYQNDKGA